MLSEKRLLFGVKLLQMVKILKYIKLPLVDLLT